MFWPARALVKAQSDKNELQKEIAQLKEAIDSHNRTCEENTRKDVHTSTFAINFDVMNVFSIERGFRDKYTAYTVLGYFTPIPIVGADNVVVGTKNEMHEWSLYCSHEEHNRIVQEFNEWKLQKSRRA
jgi:hypothetical protein